MQELQRPDDEIARVRNMILATAHAAKAETPDEALLLDIDLSILGGDETDVRRVRSRDPGGV